MQNLLLKNALIANDFSLTEHTQVQLLKFIDLLEKWNRAYNLTAIRDKEKVIFLHILDSLSANNFLKGDYILDVGTGAGFPGIPLSLINPQKKFLLLDSNNKKIRFLQNVVHELKLDNVELAHTRVENFHAKKCFTTIVSRAFASINQMITFTNHLLCPDGQFLAMKGVYPATEIAELPNNFKVTVEKIIIKGLDAERCLALIKRSNNE